MKVFVGFHFGTRKLPQKKENKIIDHTIVQRFSEPFSNPETCKNTKFSALPHQKFASVMIFVENVCSFEQEKKNLNEKKHTFLVQAFPRKTQCTYSILTIATNFTSYRDYIYH